MRNVLAYKVCRAACMVILALLPALSVSLPFIQSLPVLADGGAGWYLQGAVDIQKNFDKPSNPACYYGFAFNAADGNCSCSWSYKDAGCTRQSGGCSGTGSGSVTWTPPPAYLQPGSTHSFNLAAQASPGPCNLSNKASASVYVNNGKISYVSSAANPNSDPVQWKVPTGSAGVKLTVEVNANPDGGTWCTAHYYYNYVYRLSAPVTYIPPATGTMPADPLQPANTGTAGGTPQLDLPQTTATEPGCPGKCIDSGIRFNLISGEVDVRHCWEKSWRSAKMDMIICEGDVIKTGEDSGCQVAFADMSSPFDMKSEKEVQFALNQQDSKIKLLAGNIWINIKKIMTEGSFEVDMYQTAASIKGTTLVCQETGSQSTVKVIEGTVDLTGKADGKKVTLTAGQTATATSTGIGQVKNFDVAAEKAKWDKIGSTSSGTKKSTSKGLCFIATAAYGSESAAALETLRSFRDEVLMKSEAGAWLVEQYYRVSPPLAEIITGNEALKTLVRFELLDPVVTLIRLAMPELK